MSDIAKRAGVHTTTVSMALRNHRNLPDKTIKRIKKLAEEMGYRPDPALNALVSYRHTQKPPSLNATLAYLTNWNTENGWHYHTAHQRFFDGAKKTAERLGYKLDHFWLKDPGLTSKRLNDILQSRGICGLMFASCPPGDELEPTLEWSRFTGVKIDYYPSQVPFHSVTNDQQSIIQLAVQKIIEKGYTRVGLVIPQLWDDYVRRAWSIGFLASQRNLNPRDHIPILIYDISPGRGDSDNVLRVPNALLKRWIAKYKPQVILSYSPYVVETFQELGIVPGRDIGYADLFLEKNNGAVAGVVNQCEQVSRIAVEILVGQIQQNALGLPPFQTKTLIEGVWLDGDTLK
jgi:LacI family transcriptional regulator